MVKAGHSAKSVAQFILETCNAIPAAASVTPMQLIKLTYIAHGWVLALNGRPLVNENVEAWRYGPVYPSLYAALKKYRSNPVDCVPGASAAALDEEDAEVVREVCKVYGPISGIELSSMTHQQGSPWHVAWRSHGQSGRISNDLIEGHYRKLSEEATA